jgi:hypothetical protein
VEGSGLDEGGVGLGWREQVLNGGGRTISDCGGQDKVKKALEAAVSSGEVWFAENAVKERAQGSREGLDGGRR